jgi:hypothetical protein
MHSNSSFSWALYESVLLVAQRPGMPTDADWSEYVKDAGVVPFTGVLVVGEGNKLSPTQRADAGRLLRRNGARNAVVTSSAVSRGVMIALGWLGVKVRAFGPADFNGAFDYLGVPVEQRGEALALVKALRSALEAHPPRVAAGV